MGRVKKGIGCSVVGCGNRAVRSLSRESVSQAGIRTSSEGRRAYLCAEHYKEWKKATKSDRDLHRARFG